MRHRCAGLSYATRHVTFPAILACGCTLAVAAGSALATPAVLMPVVVTATRAPTPLSNVLADVTVLTREDLDRQPAGAVGDVLQRLGGLQVARNGGPVSATSVFTRGAESRFTAVLVDGMRVDSQATGGASWESMPLAQIDRIEVVRGPASALYGSDAMAGVVQIFTRRGQPGPTEVDVGFGAGTQRTAQLDGGVRGAADVVDYALHGAYERSSGFNAISDMADANYAPDRDGYRQRSASAHVGARLDERHRMNLHAMSERHQADFDGGNARNISHRGLDALRAVWVAQWQADWHSELSVGQSRDHYATQPSLYETTTRLRTLAWQHDMQWGPHGVQATVERREDALENPNLDGFTLPLDDQRHQNSVALGYRWREGQGPLIQANVRHDRDSEFGGQSTGGLSVGVPLAPGWRAHAGSSTGFRAPTLYQRFSEYGNADLSAESSRNVELGLNFEQGRDRAKATVYRNRIANLIDFDTGLAGTGVCASSYGCYVNVASSARLQGLSLDASTDWHGVSWGVNADFLSTRNAQTGERLARRAERTANLSAETDVKGWRVGAQWRLVSRRVDRLGEPQTLGGYGTVGVHAQHRVAPAWTLQTRLDNLTNKGYEEAGGYATPPRSVFVGVRWARV